MEKIRYFIKEGFRSIWSNSLMTVASIGVLAICLLLLGSSYVFSRNLSNVIKQVEAKNQIVAYLKEGLDQKAIDAVNDQINAIPNVKSTTFVSKAEAMQQAQSTLSDQSALLQSLANDNPFPNSYKIVINDMTKYSQTSKQLSKITGVERVSDNAPIADKLVNINSVINRVSVLLFLILIAVALFLIANTIKIAVFVRRREINIMKFVGATNGFIRWPFVVEGIFLGLVSSVVAMAAQYFVYTKLIVGLFAALNMHSLPSQALMPYVVAGFALSGILAGVAGSMISLHRYLKV